MLQPSTIQSRSLRRQSTSAEQIIWRELRSRQFQEYKFRRQHPIGLYYIVDFYCHSRNVVVEIDGDVHGLDDQRTRDDRRSDFLMSQGFSVLRYSNRDVYENLPGVLEALRRALTPTLSRGERGIETVFYARTA